MRISYGDAEFEFHNVATSLGKKVQKERVICWLCEQHILTQEECAMLFKCSKPTFIKYYKKYLESNKGVK